jgi:hypothetical protein
MHSHRTSANTGQWDVYFDAGEGTTAFIIKTFRQEHQAARFAHYLNGGNLEDHAQLIELIKCGG